MKDLETCLDELQDEDYPYTTTRNEFVDADLDESTTKAACNALLLGDNASFNLFARSHFQAVIDAMNQRAETMSTNSRSLFDEPVTEFDVRKYA